MSFSSSDICLSPSLAAVADAPVISLTDALLLLVFAGLSIATYQLHRIVRQLAALETRLNPAAPPPGRSEALAPPVPVAAPAEEVAGTPEEIRAIVAAVAYTMLGKSARVVAISDGVEATHVWSLEGRRQIFASHQVR